MLVFKETTWFVLLANACTFELEAVAFVEGEAIVVDSLMPAHVSRQELHDAESIMLTNPLGKYLQISKRQLAMMPFGRHIERILDGTATPYPHAGEHGG